jgi:hypothetical protein
VPVKCDLDKDHLFLHVRITARPKRFDVVLDELDVIIAGQRNKKS